MSSLIATHAQTENKVDELREWVWPLVQRLSTFPEVEGVVLLAGVAKRPYRAFADIYSDVDLAVFLNKPIVPNGTELKPFVLDHQDQLPSWLPDYQFFVPLPSGGEREVNIHQLLYSYECREDVEWPESKKETYAYTSDIVYDREGRVRQLIATRTRYDFKARDERLAWLAVQVPWSGWRNPQRQLRRGLIMTAHDLVNEAVDLVVEGLFLLNSRYRPHCKWRLIIAEELPWKPPRFTDHIREAMLILSLDQADVERRMAAVQELWLPMLNRALNEGMIPADYERYVATHLSLNRQLRVETLADRIVAVIKGLDLPVDYDHLRAFINFSVIKSTAEFLEMLNDPTFEYPIFFQQDWVTLRLYRVHIRQALLREA